MCFLLKHLIIKNWNYKKEVIIIAYSTKLSDAIHILSYIYIFKDEDLSSQTISKSIKTNPSVVRRLMSKLKASKLIQTETGKAKPTLTRDPSEITFYHIYRSVEENPIIFHTNPDTNMDCPEGAVIQEVLETHYQSLQQRMEAELSQHTLSEVIVEVKALGKI